ncbi:M56 family metallopeptidase [Pedobacter sp. N23S346]|uniref:M56 family metallopeptidase n=1 Tax=Pedobacter sp. N23S346 TaxID=3402750 RepID=UPI003ACCD6E6
MEWLKYLLEVSSCTTLFFGFYFLVLRRLTFFRFNRFYLLGTLLMSFIIPTLQFNLQRELVVAHAEILPSHPELKFNNAATVHLSQPLEIEYKEVKSPINWFGLLPYVYGAIGLTILLIHLYKLFVLLRYTTNYVKNEAGLKLISKKTGFTNCSFFNYVFIDQESLNDAELDVLIQHEKVHARQFHSADKLLLMILKAFLWFNPIIYLYDRALEQVNEYEADETTSLSVGNHAYANLLLKLAITKTDMPLVLNFVKNPLKDRIKMLFNSKSKSMKKLVYLLALPPAFGLVCLFAIQVVYAQTTIAMKSESKLRGSVIHEPKSDKASHSLAKETKIALVKEDTSLNKINIVPTIISYQKLTGDVKHHISYIEGAEIQIDNGILKAEMVEYNLPGNIIIAKKASFEKNGKIETGDQIIFDLAKNTHSVLQPLELEITNALETDAKVEYRADSVKYSKGKNIIYLFGNAKVSYGQTTISGSKIIYNGLNRILTAEQAELSSTANKTVKADSIFYDLKTGKAKLFGVGLDR